MFPRAYFPAAYFPAAYWPAGASVAPAGDLLEAIYLAFQGAGLDPAFPGGLWLDRAPNGVEYPFAVISVASDVDDFDTSDTHQREISVQFAAYDTDKEAARSARLSLRTEFLPARDDWVALEWSNGQEIGRFPAGQTLDLDPDRGPGGVDVWQATFTVRFSCEESYGSGS